MKRILAWPELLPFKSSAGEKSTTTDVAGATVDPPLTLLVQTTLLVSSAKVPVWRYWIFCSFRVLQLLCEHVVGLLSLTVTRVICSGNEHELLTKFWMR